MIDLTLAVNFIPAVVCLCKAAFISFTLCLLTPGEHLGGFVVFVIVLNLDRAISSGKILDESSVQCCILASWVINFLRALAVAPRLVDPITTFFWVCFGFCLVLEPKWIQEFFVIYGKGGLFRRILPGVLTSLFVVVMAFTPMKEETGVVKSSRTMCFACLCVTWVYVVSVFKPKGNSVFECHLLLSRFCPILYVQWVVAATYAAGCVIILGYHYFHMDCDRSDPTNLNNNENLDIPSTNPHTLVGLTNPKPNINNLISLNSITPIVEDDEDLEAYFRTACQSRQN
jgi:hypothetical protein